MFWWVDPQVALTVPSTAVGLKPPWNQPHVTPRALIRSPMFLLVFCRPTVVEPEQSSNAGSGSAMIVPLATLLPCEVSGVSWEPFGLGPGVIAPCVSPEIRFSAPGVDGPNCVVQALSLSA